MNIFVVNLDPVQAARDLANQHIVKMPLETAQMLCSVSARHGKPGPYKAAYTKHPCTLWAGDTYPNWYWLWMHGIALCEEYTARYGKRHASQDVIEWCICDGAWPQGNGSTPFAQAMPDQYKRSDVVEAYRAYYIGEKLKFAKWEPRAERPSWLPR